ncbi:MAG: cytoplasmic protein [Methylomonas lenta]|nr:cytoplasmic protein [Methylomonas lenta]
MAKWTEEALKYAHQQCFRNEASVKASHLCGCFHCLSIFNPSSINPDDIYPESDGICTVWCPKCGIDSVIGDSTGIAITPGFLNAMEARYFSFKIRDLHSYSE